MKPPKTGDIIDGFEIIKLLHTGGMAKIFCVEYPADKNGIRKETEFPLVMKIPRMNQNDGAENIVSFEVELQIMPNLTGSHVPHFLAAGEISTNPYILMEHIRGKTLDQYPTKLEVNEIAKLGASIAHAVHSLHKQNVCHQDLKPANIIIREDGSAVILDFGLSYHSHFPDLLAEEMRKAIGSPTWIAPEQVVGTRGDPRSDIFAIGVMLYELATGELPFGSPQTTAGLRQRLWMDPKPPRIINPLIPTWLQEIILCCLETEADNRYPSAAHLALDLLNHNQIKITERGEKNKATGFYTHLIRWLKAAGREYNPSPIPSVQIEKVPILMVAIPNKNVSEHTLSALRNAAERSLGIRPGARLTCVTIIPLVAISSTNGNKSEIELHRHHLNQLQKWAKPLQLSDHQISFHVLEASDVADAIIKYAISNHVNIIIMGAATHGLKLQRLAATVPTKVAMYSPCTLILVK
jgi:serine/threonine protein kinase